MARGAPPQLIPVARASLPPTPAETSGALALGLAVSAVFFGFERGRLFEAFVLATGLGSLFASATAQVRSDGRLALFLRGLDRPALVEAALIFAAGLWALLSALRYPSLGPWGFIPAWGTLLLSFSAAKASWRRGTHWLLVSRGLRLPALLAPVLTQRMLAWFWGDGGSVAVNTATSIAFIVSWCSAGLWLLEQSLLNLGQRPFIARLAPALPTPKLLRFETIHAAPSEAPLPADKAESLVEKGGFRIDAQQAIRKLGQFQLLEGAAFLVPWLRAAVAAGASRIEARADGGLLELRFDGLPLPPEVLRDPYSGLLGSESGPAPRQVAIGLLALMRLSPNAVELVSGLGAARRRTRAPAEDGPDDPPEPGTDSILRVRWTGFGASQRAGAALEHLRSAYGMSDATLSINGVLVPDPVNAGPALAKWKTKHDHGAALPLTEVFSGPRLRFYFLGALVEEVVLSEAPAARYFTSSDLFTLNLSQSAVVDDAVRQAAVERALKYKQVVREANPTGPIEASAARWPGRTSWVWATWLAAVIAAALL